ncbi:MAG: antitoxin [Desulfobacterales bacterium]
MKAITIRGIEPEVAEKLKQTANRQGKSANKLILDMIKKELGFEKEKQFSRQYNDLDELFGRWDEAEFREISGIIEQERNIDPDLWS